MLAATILFALVTNGVCTDQSSIMRFNLIVENFELTQSADPEEYVFVEQFESKDLKLKVVETDCSFDASGDGEFTFESTPATERHDRALAKEALELSLKFWREAKAWEKANPSLGWSLTVWQSLIKWGLPNLLRFIIEYTHSRESITEFCTLELQVKFLPRSTKPLYTFSWNKEASLDADYRFDRRKKVDAPLQPDENRVPLRAFRFIGGVGTFFFQSTSPLEKEDVLAALPFGFVDWSLYEQHWEQLKSIRK